MIIFLWVWLDHAFYRDFLQSKKKRNGIFTELIQFLDFLSEETGNRFKLLLLKAAFERRKRGRQVKLRSGSNPLISSRSHSSLNASPSGSPPPTIRLGVGEAKAVSQGLVMSQTISVPPSPITSRLSEGAPKKLEVGKFEFKDLEPLDIAQQLTIIEFEMYKNLLESEFFNLAWRSDKKVKVSPNIAKLIDRFNAVSYWVATEIVMTIDLKERANVLRKFISVAESLKEMNNYNGLMEIVGGLNMWSITRLNETWNLLPRPVHQTMEQLNEIMATQNNYKNYRSALKISKLPALPYLGVYLRDLTFIAENENYLDEEKKLINFEKLKMIGQLISELKKYQVTEFNFEINDALQIYLSKLVTLPEEMIIHHSLICEKNQKNRDSS